MTTPALPLLPSDEIVAVAWLASVPGLSVDMVGTVLPPDVDPTGITASWVQSGFVTVSVVGGTPDDLLPVNRPVLQVDCWATVPGSNKPPWLKAAAIAQAIKYATWDRIRIPRPLVPTVNGVQYPMAIVQSAYLANSFRRIYDDQGDYSRFQADLALTWFTARDRLD